MKTCCGYAPRVLVDQRWVCSECSSIVLDEETSQLNLFDHIEDPDFTFKKCTCGSEKTYGKDATHTFHCDLYKEKK